MQKTVLLCFIHGFKGGLDTFDKFPQDLQDSLNEPQTAPELTYKSIVYPPYDTKGDFRLAVSKLREWLQNIVIDLEAANDTPSPTVNGSVKIILLGHSMGGLVGSDAIIDIHKEYAPALHWPHVFGIVALDSPMLGLAPSLWQNGIDGVFRKGKTLYDSASSLSALGSGLFASTFAARSATKSIEEDKKKGKTETGSSAFGNWKSIAALSAAGALAAGGALYTQKETLSRGFSWISDHLEFIGTLRKQEELSARTVSVNSIDGVFFSCYYTSLAAVKGSAEERLFISLPKGQLLRSRFHASKNTIAQDEVTAHTTMFTRALNSDYDRLVREVRAEIGEWSRSLILPALSSTEAETKEKHTDEQERKVIEIYGE